MTSTPYSMSFMKASATDLSQTTATIFNRFRVSHKQGFLEEGNGGGEISRKQVTGNLVKGTEAVWSGGEKGNGYRMRKNVLWKKELAQSARL